MQALTLNQAREAMNIARLNYSNARGLLRAVNRAGKDATHTMKASAMRRRNVTRAALLRSMLEVETMLAARGMRGAA